jgi:hypothetical protein
MPDRAELAAWRKDWDAVLDLLTHHRPEYIAGLMTPAERRNVLDEMAHVADYLDTLRHVLAHPRVRDR